MTSDESRRAPDRWMRLPSTGMLITFLCLGCNKPRERAGSRWSGIRQRCAHCVAKREAARAV